MPAFGLAVLAARLAFVVLAAATCRIGLLLTLLQPQLGLADCLEMIFSALDLRGQVYLGLVLLQIVDRLGVVEQPVARRQVPYTPPTRERWRWLSRSKRPVWQCDEK